MSNLYESVLLVNYLHKQYGKNLNGLFDEKNREQAEKVFLSAIMELSVYKDSEPLPLFTEGVRGERSFTLETMSLDHIQSLEDLYDTIVHINHMLLYVNEAFYNDELLDKRFDEFPKQVKNITRDNVLTFLNDSYQVKNFNELWKFGRDDNKKIFCDMYRAFTGCLLKQDAGDYFLLCEYKNEALEYPVFVDFLYKPDLFKHITYMKAIKANLYQRELEDAEERKQMRMSQLFGKEKSQEQER